MQEIQAKYNLDLDDFFKQMETVSNRLGTVEDTLVGMRRQNPFVEASKSAAQFNTVLGQQVQAYQRAEGVATSYRNEQKRLEAQLKELKSRQLEFIAAGKYGELKGKIAQVEEALKAVNHELGEGPKKTANLSGAFDKLGQSIKTAFTITGILFVIEKVIELGKKVLEVTSAGETYQNQFTRIFEGNAQVAEGYLAILQKTADTTNFTFDTLADNVAKLASRGIIPTEKELLKLGDTANFINKPFEQLNEAILDGSNPERWKELGFVVSSQGNKMTLSYGDFTKTVDKSVKGAYEAIQAFAEQGKVLGSTAEAGKTLGGRLSTLADNFASIFRTIGQGTKGALNDFLDLLSDIVLATKELIQSTAPTLEALGTSFLSLAKAVGSVVTALVGYDDQANTTATTTQRIGYYLEKYLIKPLTGITLIVSGAIEGFNQLFLYLEYASAKVRGDKSLAAALDAQLAESKKRIAAIQQQLREGDKRITLQDYVNEQNQHKRQQEARARQAQQAAEGFTPTAGGKTPAQVDAEAVKAAEDKNKLLLKAQEEYVKEYQKLEAEFGKARLEALKSDESAYIREKARLDKAEIDAQEAHLLKLLQLASSNKTQINKSTGQREVVANSSVGLPADIKAQFDASRKEIDNAADRQIRINRIRQEYELLELGQQSNAQELALYDKKWEGILAIEKEGSEKYLALVRRLDADRNALVQDQLIRDQKAQEQISLYNIQVRTKSPNQTGQQFAKTNQLDEVATQIVSAENQIFGLTQQNDPKNTPEIKRLEAYVKALKDKRKEIELLTPVNRDIWDLLGISKSFKDDAERDMFLKGMQTISDAIQQTTNLIVQQSEEKIQALDAQIQAKEQQVSEEEARDKEGYANNLALRKAELNDLKRQKAEEEATKRKAVAVQQALDTASIVSNNAVTASNLISSAAKAFDKSISSTFNPVLGVILAIGAIATIFATITAVSAKAKSISKLRKGGRIPLHGRTHEQGGHRIEGTDIEAERGEWVTNAKSSEQYNDTLEAINQHDPKKAFYALLKEGGFGLPQLVIQQIQHPGFGKTPQLNTARLENQIAELTAEIKVIKQHTKPVKQIYPLADGSYLEVDGGKTTHKKP